MLRIALVLGATGLVGKAVTEELLNREGWGEVRVLVRTPLALEHPKLKQIVVDWENLAEYSDSFEGVHSIFCCLGTTIKKAGSQEKFERVDLDYPLAAATIARDHGVKQFLVVSSMGADAKSRNFYSRTKGRAEEALSKIGFQGLHLFRPSLLLGHREEFRLGERVAARLMKALEFVMVGKAAKYRAIPGVTVARAMVNIASADTHGLHIYTNEVIHVIGKR
ncbi:MULTISPECIES: oxidoreductase [Paenibacillus]|uniref:oxidoreductase n=1 Tax=Paenibacillus TaxID=44249 RepID=UPI0004F6E251|nr:oxidoreductase [Paenibacillus odorifer]AIQ72242.1 nucleoside-diphosphate sugar epimerase [Paenibacillus odorifer]OMC98460.1 nucleoside-diphosphate sugar epimerase [Paenibacillus odorifer]OME29717.1 nucleoside-diphosphate sugar epimerase [Paenibacillus odorifer]OME35400.1 nucleoside-diphosphate sugar epimerase [Paenibacillus odorifer]OME51300.1 nucleoside-diphosphate sugar epimerase [Paenibacillus odorifer]